MELKLKIYTDDTLQVVDRVAEADGIKIPYRTSMYLIKNLDGINLDSENDLIDFITKNIDCLDKILKATFKISESDLECIETTELIETIKCLYLWVIKQVNGIKGNNGTEKNSVEAM